jgi:hypothetical protein
MSLLFSTPASSSGSSFFKTSSLSSMNTSGYSNDPSHPSLPNPCEKRLGRHGNDRAHCILFKSEQNIDFMTWWTETKWYQENQEKTVTWTVEKKQAQIWEHFCPAARLRDGEPWVFCTRCDEVLSHPSVKGTGTSSMTRHIATKGSLARARLAGKTTVLEKPRAKVLVCKRTPQRLLRYPDDDSFQPQLKLWFLMAALL